MLPLTLTLENFMPYRGLHEPISFQGLGIACLSGENGAGKSALLDAITWVLWGRSRAGASADPLVAAGASEMDVRLEFLAQGDVYRVERRYRKRGLRGGAGRTTFDFQIKSGDTWRPLNGTNVSETGRKVEETIRLDYDTFINTAFLVQGKADLFVSQRPAQRKRILSEILNLSVYDRLAQKARELAAEDSHRREAARISGAGIDAELEQEATLREQAEQARIALDQLREQLAATTLEMAAATARVAELDGLAAELARANERILELKTESSGLAARRNELEWGMQDARALLARREEIERGAKELRATQLELELHRKQALLHGELIEKRAQLRQEAERKLGILQTDISMLETRHAGLSDDAGRLPRLEEEFRAATQHRDSLHAREAALAELRAKREEMTGVIGAKRLQYSSLKTEASQLEPRLAIIDVDSHARCPVCDTELGQHGLGRVREHFQQRLNDINRELEAIATEGQALRRERDDINTAVQSDEEALRNETARADSAIGGLREQMAQAQAAHDQLRDASAQLEQARAQLAQVPAESEELRTVNDRIAEIQYNQAAHSAADSGEKALRHWDHEHRELQVADVRVERDAASLGDIARQQESNTERLDDIQTRVNEITGPLEGMDEARKLAGEASRAVDDLTRRIRETEQEGVRLNTLLDQLAHRRVDRKRLLDEEHAAAGRKSIHDDLALAFSPQGVQALLIETALPELEDDANNLLGRMTGNRMSLTLQTQRSTQAGGVQETLDVMIGDEWGTREYEMYSGGEAFRINLALRIALSKLLARRAGAEVPLLFIDEGFGSQDAEGRDRLIEAITILWNDPAFHDGLILVITHIEDIRSRFDARIDVVKTENGASVSIAR